MVIYLCSDVRRNRARKGVEMVSRSLSETQEKTRREDLIHAAFYRGEALTLKSPEYVRALDAFTGELLRQDAEQGDLTVQALGITSAEGVFKIRAKEAGVAAGIIEAQWLCRHVGLKASAIARDGEQVSVDDVLLRVEGRADVLFRLERVVVNLVQRMNGVATATREMVEMIQSKSSNAHVVATRKTPWGLLDKKAVHAGGGGTHRLSLSDAILIKTNHLWLAREAQGKSLAEAIRCAWNNRRSATFVEVEVTTVDEAVTAAGGFRDLRAPDSCPCVLMLDNFSPENTAAAVNKLKEHDLLDSVLVEASGKVDKNSLRAYAAAGVDAISIGALTHSVRALDVSAKLISGTR